MSTDPHDLPPGSPFAPGAPLEPAWPAAAADEPEPPRLGILHLLGWMVSLAVWLGWQRTLIDFRDDGTSMSAAPDVALLALSSLGAGLALGGLPIWAARRWRGLRFPIHPGEYLLVVMGLNVVFSLVLQTVLTVSLAWRDPRDDYSVWPVSILGLGWMALAVIPLWPFLRIRERRWRAFFLATVLDHFSQGCCMFSWRYSSLPGRLLSLVALAILIGAVLGDRSAKKRYPWTHWSGVAAYVWLTLVNLAWIAWLVWFREPRAGL